MFALVTFGWYCIYILHLRSYRGDWMLPDVTIIVKHYRNTICNRLLRDPRDINNTRKEKSKIGRTWRKATTRGSHRLKGNDRQKPRKGINRRKPQKDRDQQKLQKNKELKMGVRQALEMKGRKLEVECQNQSAVNVGVTKTPRCPAFVDGKKQAKHIPSPIWAMCHDWVVNDRFERFSVR